MRKSDSVDNAIKACVAKATVKTAQITLDKIEDTLKYTNGAPRKPNIHIGQRKLCLNEFEFLIQHLKSHKSAATVVYAGSAPCNHLWFLLKLFPHIKMVCVDPNETVIYVDGKKKSHYDEFGTPSSVNGLIAESGCPVVYLHADLEKMYPRNARPIVMMDLKSGKLVSADKDLANGKIYAINKSNADFVKENPSKKTEAFVNPLADYINKSPARIFIIESYYTNELSTTLSSLTGDLFFWSDIRTNAGQMGKMVMSLNKNIPEDLERILKQKEYEIPGDLDLIWNLSQQYCWMNRLGARGNMFKFRAPYMRDLDKKLVLKMSNLQPFADDISAANYEGLPILKDYLAGKWTYLAGDIYIQPWAGSNSSETRLVCDSKRTLTNYNIAEYEDKMFYYNSIERPYALHKNPFALKSFGFDLCGDCAIEAFLIEEYMKKFGEVIDINEWLLGMVAATGGRSLIDGGHGGLFKALDWSGVLKMRSNAKFND